MSAGGGPATRRPRVLFLVTGLGRGGAETQLVRVACGLAQCGWDVQLVAMMEGNRFGNDLEAAGVRFRSLGLARGQKSPRAAWTLLHLLRAERPDVFVSFMLAANIAGPPLARLAGVSAVVASVRLSVTRRPRTVAALAATLRLCDAIVFNSALVRDDTVRRHIAPASRARVIRNGLDLHALTSAAPKRAEARRAFDLPDDTFAWVSVAHFRRQKNLPTLVRAFRQLSDEHPNARLLLAGAHFDDTERVIDAAGDLLERGVVRLLGRVEDVPGLLAASDAFVLSSRYEASPNALLEAMAAGLPSVATDVGGVREVIDAPALGIVVASADEPSILDGMRLVMAMPPGARRAMGEAAAASVRHRFGGDRLVDEWDTLLTELVEPEDR